MQRRNFVRSLLGGTLFSGLGLGSRDAQAVAEARFAHGVASGDPQADRVVIWTRVSGVLSGVVPVQWTVASDAAMKSVLKRGSFDTDSRRDFTVKVDVDGLPAGSTLYYRFDIETPNGFVASPVGRSKTLPVGKLSRARFAVASCANYPYGYFHAYRDIAERADLDAVIHLGDYIYEYGLGEYATEYAEQLGRVPDPVTEATTLADIRLRHAQYKSDPDLQAMHAAHPMIAVWDDHELSNDAWRDGAQNHQASEGEWPERRDAAIQAWLEWMPVRASHQRADTRIYRQFDYGDLLSLIMLDTRLIGRDLQPDAGADRSREAITRAMQDTERGLLGNAQAEWLRQSLARSRQTWQIIGQQVMVSPTRSPDLEPLLDLEQDSMLSTEQLQHYIAMSKGGPPMLLDTWNGYPVARQQLLGDLARHARNPVLLSGDLHTSLAGNLQHGDDGQIVAVELMTGSISSPGFAQYLPENRAGAVRDATLELNPSLVYMETDRRGWMALDITAETCRAEWQLLDSVHRDTYTSTLDTTLEIRAGRMADGLQRA